MPPSKTEIPPLKWIADDHALVYSLINILIQYPALRKNIWPAPGEKGSGKTKTVYFQDVADRLLAGQEPYNTFVRTTEGRKAYGKSVGYQLRTMASKWRSARDELGVTGAGLNHETEIWEDEQGEPLRDIWTRVKQTCPYFYALKPLLGERMSVTDHAVNNSDEHPDTGSLMTRKLTSQVSNLGPEASTGSGPVARAESVEDDEEPIVDPNPNGEREKKGKERAIDNEGEERTVDSDIGLDDELDSTQRFSLSSQTIHASTPAASGSSCSARGSASTPVDPEILPKTRAPKSAGQLSDFAQTIKAARGDLDSLKRKRDEDKEDTRQLKIKRKYDLKEKALKMNHEAEIRRIALEERKVALQELEFKSRQQFIETDSATAYGNSLLE